MHKRHVITFIFALFALLTAACGGGGDDADIADQPEATAAPATGEEQAEPVGDEVATSATSDDGMLTLTGDLPDGLTIEPADAPTIEGFTALAAYDLGPDGSTFEVPLTATFTVGPQSALYAVTHTSNGVTTFEDLEIRNDGSVTVEIGSFSNYVLYAADGANTADNAITLTADSPVRLGEAPLVELRFAGWPDERSLGYLSVPDGYYLSVPDGYDAEGALAPGSLMCSDVGQGVVIYPETVTVHLSDMSYTVTSEGTGIERDDLDAPVECVEPQPIVFAPVEVSDVRCFEKQSGADRDDCPSVEATGCEAATSEAGLPVMHCTAPSGTYAGVSMTSLDVDGQVRSVEVGDNGSPIGYYGVSFFSYRAGADDDEFYRIFNRTSFGSDERRIGDREALAFSPDGDGLDLEFPGGESYAEPGVVLSEAIGRLSDVTFLIESPDGWTALYSFSGAAIAAAAQSASAP